MIEPDHERLSVRKQCELLVLNSSSLYYLPHPSEKDDLEMMRLIDEQFLKTPFYGTRWMAAHLSQSGHPINRKRVQRLMTRMGLVAIYPGPNTSKPH
ncbi:MAG: IS3 family transposase, partial [Magnetococcus sp. DMHC-6]